MVSRCATGVWGGSCIRKAIFNCQKMNGVPWPFYCLVRVPYNEKGWQSLPELNHWKRGRDPLKAKSHLESLQQISLAHTDTRRYWNHIIQFLRIRSYFLLSPLLSTIWDLEPLPAISLSISLLEKEPWLKDTWWVRQIVFFQRGAIPQDKFHDSFLMHEKHAHSAPNRFHDILFFPQQWN